MADSARPASSLPLTLAAWAVVVLPTLWGLSYTVKNAMKLFAAPQASVSAPATPGSASPAPAAAAKP